MAIQGTSPYLQGGSAIRLQNTANPQKTAPSTTLQNTWNPQGGGAGSLYTEPSPPADTGPTAEELAAQREAAAAAAARAAALADYEKTKNVTYGSITDQINTTRDKTKSSVLDYLGQYEDSQRGIDKNAKKSELAREEGRVGILDMIGQGLRSGQVALNNSNATSSSAGDEIAKAYGRMGEKQMAKVNMGYNLEQEDIRDAQDSLARSYETFKRKYGEDKVAASNGIVQEALSALASLDSMAANAGANRIDIEGEKARIRNQALAELNAIDTILNDGVAKIKPATREQNRAEAFKLLNGNAAPQGGLGFNSTLPIYTLG